MLTQLYFILLFYGGFCAGNLLNDLEESENYDGRRFNLLPEIKNFKKRDDRKWNSRRSDDDYDNKPWTGRWFPDNQQSKMTMGIQSNCDDGKTDLKVDWDNSPVNYTCYGKIIEPSDPIHPQYYCEHIPKYYTDAHLCMNETIEYNDIIPTFGNHRPVWPVYGEYKFIPRQRWLHSIEHGAIVMLYHPCANPLVVKPLKKLVKNCIRRHIITPYNFLDRKRPLALVARGCHFTMSFVNPIAVKKFIRGFGLRGPENIPDDGDFNEELVEKATEKSDESISTLCSKYY